MKQTVYICVGLPGSGKSTFAKVLSDASGGEIVRVNQDEMGSRAACMMVAVEAMQAGKSVVVDRCNFDQVQRAHWIELAERHDARVVIDWFRVGPGMCLARANKRQNHETMNEPEKFEKIIDGMDKLFVAPEIVESIDMIRIRNESGDVQSVQYKDEETE